MNEKIIVSLTSYGERLNNLPIVLDTIYAQTVSPDIVVLNLAYEEIMPQNVEEYLIKHNVEINKVPDTKVYKKIIPTLKKYPNDCIICIDDDWLYPTMMIEDFMNTHRMFPNNPISGNRVIVKGMQCHCGCASLTKKEYLGECLNWFDEDVYANCKSDDIFYTFSAAKNNKPYVRTQNEYYLNMESYNSVVPYSENYPQGICNTFDYLVHRFGASNNILGMYLCLGTNDNIINIINDIEDRYKYTVEQLQRNNVELQNSESFRLGNFILSPLIWLKRLIKRG